MKEKIYMQVPNLKLKDLYNWADPEHKNKTTTLTKKGGKRKASGTSVWCNEKEIAMFRHGHEVYAVQEKCPHAGAPLHLGDIEETPSGLCVRCPWHNWRFELENGKTKFPEDRGVSALVYPVRIAADGALWIGFDKFSDNYFDINKDF